MFSIVYIKLCDTSLSLSYRSETRRSVIVSAFFGEIVPFKPSTVPKASQVKLSASFPRSFWFLFFRIKKGSHLYMKYRIDSTIFPVHICTRIQALFSDHPSTDPCMFIRETQSTRKLLDIGRNLGLDTRIELLPIMPFRHTDIA